MLSEGMQTIPGDAAFDLYATYGFPRDLVELMARERTMSVDGQGWDRAEEAHKIASRGERKGWLVDQSELEGVGGTATLCYEGTDAAATEAVSHAPRCSNKATTCPAPVTSHR